jgi:uncharacterized protein YbjT (DUF2867 family)/lipocalin
MRVLVTGSTGYIGGHVIPALVAEGHDVRAMTRDARHLVGRFKGVETVVADALDEASVREALQGIEVAYYLIHSMRSSRRDFAAMDRQAALVFGKAAYAAGVRRIVYLGGLGDDDSHLSKHLRSRHEVGEALRAGGVPVTELRAAMIIGPGSASFEMMRYLTERLPLMIAPKWVATRCQPIAIDDVIAYLVKSLDTENTAPGIYEIGGADVLTYAEAMMRYARIRNLKRRLLVVPFFTPALSSYWVHLVTPISASIARPLIDGLYNEVVVTNDAAERAFSIQPSGYDEALRRALDRGDPSTGQRTWFDANDVRGLPGRFAGVTQGVLIDRRLLMTTASVQSVFQVFTGLGGERGWLYADWLWELRGAIDRLVGGSGMRRGRRDRNDLRLHDVVDCWRVQEIRDGRLLRLRAEMKLPGKAWLEFEVFEEGGATCLRQTAYFEPRGVPGYLYWYFLTPFHNSIFKKLSERVVAEAERLDKRSTVAMVGGVQSVGDVDLERYAGTWFEIARLYNKFEAKCIGDVTATYSRNGNRIAVTNRCRTSNGSAEARGVARVVDSFTNAKLKVRFAPAALSWLSFVWGDYWIIGLSNEYSWATVGSPDRKYLWILSRAPALGPEDFKKAVAAASKNGFEVSRLLATPHVTAPSNDEPRANLASPG